MTNDECRMTNSVAREHSYFVVAGLWPAIEPGVTPGGLLFGTSRSSLLNPGGDTPPSTAGENAHRYIRAFVIHSSSVIRHSTFP